MEESVRQRNIRLFTLVLAFLAVAGGLGASIFSNYYSEVYHIDAIQRGFLEIPRESPGILCMLLVALLAPLGNLWMSVVAQALVLIGLVVMGLFSPSYGVMLAFLFLHSMGMHLFMPLNDAISMAGQSGGHDGPVQISKYSGHDAGRLRRVRGLSGGYLLLRRAGDPALCHRRPGRRGRHRPAGRHGPGHGRT